MSLFIGDDGGIAIAPEATWNTAGTVFAWQHGISSSLQPKRDIVRSTRLQRGRQRTEYGPLYAEGGILCEFDQALAVVGDLLRLFGNEGTGDVTVDGTEPDLESVTANVNHGGEMYQYTGLVGSSLRFDLQPEQAAQIGVEFLGGGATNPTAVAPALPAESGIFMPSDLGVVTIGAAQVCILSANIEVAFELDGSGRKCLGGTTIKQPVRKLSGITCSLNVELADDTSNDTVAQWLDFINGLAVGDISLSGGDFVLVDGRLTGDGPALQAGAQGFPLNIDCESLFIDNLT